MQVVSLTETIATASTVSVHFCRNCTVIAVLDGSLASACCLQHSVRVTTFDLALLPQVIAYAVWNLMAGFIIPEPVRQQPLRNHFTCLQLSVLKLDDFVLTGVKCCSAYPAGGSGCFISILPIGAFT